MSLQLPEMPPNKPGLMPPPQSRHALADPRQPPDSHENAVLHILPVLPSMFHNVLCQTADVFNSPMRHHGRSITLTNAQLAATIPARHSRFQHALDALEANIITAKMAIHRDYRRRVAERVKREVEEAAEAAKVDKENGETEKAERERAEQERLEKEKLEKEKLVKERLEQERLMMERLEKERLEREGVEKETLEKEGLEEAQSKLEWERAKREKEQAEKEKADSAAAAAAAGRGAVQQQLHAQQQLHQQHQYQIEMQLRLQQQQQLHQELQRQQIQQQQQQQQQQQPTLTHPSHGPVVALPQQRQGQGQAATAVVNGSNEPQTINGGEQVAENNGEEGEEDVDMVSTNFDELFGC